MMSKDVETGQNGTEQNESEKELSESETEHDSQQQARTNNPPPAKKQRTKGKKKMTAVEKVTAAMMKSFVGYQERAEEQFMKFEEMKAREDRAHEEHMLRLLLASQANASAPFPAMYYSGQNYDADFQNNSYGGSDY